jgi:hypothetical protein
MLQTRGAAALLLAALAAGLPERAQSADAARVDEIARRAAAR